MVCSYCKEQKHISITPPSFIKFCPVVPEICRGQVHGARKERRRIIIIRHSNRSPLEEQFCIFKMAAKTWHKNGG
jgi:hypothetical protein